MLSLKEMCKSKHCFLSFFLGDVDHLATVLHLTPLFRIFDLLKHQHCLIECMIQRDALLQLLDRLSFAVQLK